jgi:hypothetical protein
VTDSQIDILRNEIRDGFKASALRDAAFGQKVDAIEARLADMHFAINTLMEKLLAPSERTTIRAGVRAPADMGDSQQEAR